MSKQVITRFAPSPTGLLHIGGARTALFNWLYSRKEGGKFFLRIEDTDQLRSTKAAVDAIINGLKWLGLLWDGDIVFQSQRCPRHQEVAKILLEAGKAYHCYLTPEEIEEFRQQNPGQKLSSPWREQDLAVRPSILPTVRLRNEAAGETTLKDLVHGEVFINNSQLDDMIILRSDGTPTYMFAVVVDDHDMQVNHVIRGDDHLTNAFRQLKIYQALGWELPRYAHIPLIHGSDGAKLSKRHGALGVEAYKDMGYLPEALCNYLLRLGWSHSDIEIIEREEVAKIFSLSDIGKSAARFDIDKLNHINAYYLQKTADEVLLGAIERDLNIEGNQLLRSRVLRAMPILKTRVKTLVELVKLASVFIAKSDSIDEKSQAILKNFDPGILELLENYYRSAAAWDKEVLKGIGIKAAQDLGVSPGFIMQFLRASVLGTFDSPGIYEVMEILGQSETLSRLSKGRLREVKKA